MFISVSHASTTLRIGESLDVVLKHLQGTMVAPSKGFQALPAAIRNWQHPGARKKKAEHWYDGPSSPLTPQFPLGDLYIMLEPDPYHPTVRQTKDDTDTVL
jgi:hypothetical protein